MLILSGIIVGALFSALLSLLKYVGDPESKLPLIEFWPLGSLSSISLRELWVLLGVFIPCSTVLWLLRWRINLLALGDDEARALGVRPSRLRAVLITASTLLAASTVAVAGIIGWVGLVVPHAARILVGADFRRVLPTSAALGACYLMLVDDLARTTTQAELPIGVLTALVGAPVFAILLRRARLGLGVILTVRDARFAYRGRAPIFAGLGFRLESREVLCILGPNGVGKSTLLRCLAGLTPFSAGTLTFDAAHPGRSIGFVPQSDQPVFAFDVRTVVEMGRAPHLSWTAMPGVRDRVIVGRVMERLGIGHLAGRLYPELSGGERQLVMMARALAQEPRLLILDEPTSHLDFANQASVLELVRGLADDGLGVLMTTHDPDHAFLVADQALVLGRGAALRRADPDVLTEARLSQTYGRPVRIRAVEGHVLCFTEDPSGDDVALARSAEGQ